MRTARLFMAGLVLLPVFVSGCGKTQTEVTPPPMVVPTTVQPPSPQPAADSGSIKGGANQVVADTSNATPAVTSGSQPQATALPNSPISGDTPIENMDSRVQEALRNFHTAADKIDRSTMASDLAKLADAGVPKQQIASALGYMFRDENSVEVKTDILNELGDLDDPSAFDQIVRGLDQHQPDEVRTAAIEALDSLGDKRAIPVLQPLLADRDEDIRDAAQSATDSLNDQ